MCSVDVDSTGNHCEHNHRQESPSRRDREEHTYPTGHETKTTETRADTESTLTTELDGDETERLVTRRDEREVRTAEQVRRERSELGLRVHAVGVHLHEARELLSGETTVEIDDGADGDELDGGALVEPDRPLESAFCSRARLKRPRLTVTA